MSKKQGDQIHFYQEKARKKNQCITLVNSSYRSMNCVIKWVIDSLFLQDTFFVSKRYHVLKKKQLRCDDIKKIGSV